MISSKQLGVVLIIIGVLIAGLTLQAKLKEDFYIDALTAELGGVCTLENGYCLHEDRSWTLYIVGFVLGAAVALLGVYLLFFERTYEAFRLQQAAFAKEVGEAKRKDEFGAYLAGFSIEEQAVLKAVREQDGITQSTLRYRTGMSKASLSMLLDSLEKRDVVRRKAAGKTKEVYLRKKF